MEIIRLSELSRDKAIRRLCQLLERGKIIAYPTETYYGLGAKYDREDSLKRIYTIKRRPHEKAMPLIIGKAEQLSLLTPLLPDIAQKLIKQFWPGPLTLILQAREDLSCHITANTGKVAVRIPGPSFALDLARHLDFPITATSANVTGMPPAETAGTVINYFGNLLHAVVESGITPGTAPSTIVDVTGREIRVVRQGIIPAEAIVSAVQR